jgi:hypothetical protein
LGWVESCVDGEDKRLNRLSTVDFADTWPSDRIRAGSLSYNWGTTYGWMRLIDPSGMSPEQKCAHDRAYFGHVLMHDCGNPYDIGRPMLLRWGMDDDRVKFWPFWSNRDVIHGAPQDVKVSAWALPDRLLLCAFNYSHTQAADCTIPIDLKAMGVTLPVDAQVANLEQPDQVKANGLGLSPGRQFLEGDAAEGTVRLHILPRDFVLVSFSVD